VPLIGSATQALTITMPKDLNDSPQLLGEISQAPSAFEQFLERNQKALLVLAILAAVGGCGFVIYRGVQTGNENEAGANLVKADDLPALQAITANFPATAAGSSAIVLTAEKQWSSGQKDLAIETLNSFIKSKPQHPAIPSAQASLGSKLMSLGKNAEAAAAFQAVVDNKNGRFLAPYALTQLGDLAKLAGDTDKAKGFYDRAQSDYPGSSFGRLSSQHLVSVKAKPPTEVEAPANQAPTPPQNSDVVPTDLFKPQGGAPFGGLVNPDPADDPLPTVPTPVLPPTTPTPPPATSGTPAK